MFGRLSLLTEPLENGFALLIDEFGVEKEEGLDTGGRRSSLAIGKFPSEPSKVSR